MVDGQTIFRIGFWRLRWALVGLSVLLAAPLAGAEPAGEAPASFTREVRPVLEANCFKCHGPAKKKGGVDFSALADDASALRERKLWQGAVEQIQTGEMPPHNAPPLPPEQRERLLQWMRRAAVYVDCSDPAALDPGPPLVRRLNRAEYDHTIRDLVGIDFDSAAAVGMPDDKPAEGYATLANALVLPPVMMEKYFAAADAILDRVMSAAEPPAPLSGGKGKPKPNAKAKKGSDSDPGQARRAHDAIFVAPLGEGAETERTAARAIIERFARGAYRRPVQPPEIDRLLRLYDLAQAKNEPFEVRVRLMLKAVLVSPHFLLRIEREPSISGAPSGAGRAERISDHELAVRLSYFIWSTMPDRALSDLADAGSLSEPATLQGQVKRMLADPRARALTEQFAVQWLQLDKINDARPSTEFFPTFNAPVKQAMYDEAILFFDKLRDEDRPIFDLLDADYAYVNADLARHYGLPGVEGKEMRKVSLKPGDHRGGLLGMGAVLAMTSHTSRTSPTLRGKYILEVIFGAPPPPPPPDAGKLKENGKKGEIPLSFREQMAQHAADPTCASCHKRIDPLGYGLENFDAVGRWRDQDAGRPLDNAGRLPTGESFAGVTELKRIILDRKDRFTRNTAEQMLTYALGRHIEHYDECALRGITTAMDRNSGRFSSLVLGVVQSYPFQHRRASDRAPTTEPPVEAEKKQPNEGK